MAPAAFILGQAAPTLVEQLIFHGAPSPLMGLLYRVAIVAAVFLPVMSMAAMFGIWWERKVAGHIQSRIGPNRVGPIGLLQSIADGVKLILKEDLCPREADAVLFRLAPYLAFTPVFAAMVALPFAPDLAFEPRINIGLFWILAILSVEVMGVILAGWSSNNKWAVYGAMREACQMVSYEIPLGISIIVGVMAAGTLNMMQLGHLQGGGVHTWIVFRNPFALAAFVLYFVASLASNKRAPFDLPESESELVAGYHTEYSGLRFSFFFFAEYAAMFVIGGIQTALFLGGWNDPLGLIGYAYPRLQAAWLADHSMHHALLLLALNLAGVGMFTAKVLVLVFTQMWIRWTLPRPRIDQVLYTCIKVLLPMGCALLLGAALWQLFIPEMPGVPWVNYQPFNPATWSSGGLTRIPSMSLQALLALLGVGGYTLVLGWVAYAIASGRNIKQRLTDPAPIDQGPKLAA